jgi:hypothetical protein
MNLKTMFVINAILTGVFGLGFLLAPEFLVASFGAQIDLAGAMIARAYGSTHLAAAFISWLIRNNNSSYTRRVIAFGFALEHTLIALVLLFGVLSGVLNATGWSSVVIDLLLAIGFFVFGKNEPIQVWN